MGAPEPSPWIVRFAPLVPPGGSVLDVAAGSGRHTRLLPRPGPSGHGGGPGHGRAGGSPRRSRIDRRVPTSRTASPFPFRGREFAGVVVTNYLHRPILPDLVAAVAAGRRPDLRDLRPGPRALRSPEPARVPPGPGELLEAVGGSCGSSPTRTSSSTTPAPGPSSASPPPGRRHSLGRMAKKGAKKEVPRRRSESAPRRRARRGGSARPGVVVARLQRPGAGPGRGSGSAAAGAAQVPGHLLRQPRRVLHGPGGRAGRAGRRRAGGGGAGRARTGGAAQGHPGPDPRAGGRPDAIFASPGAGAGRGRDRTSAGPDGIEAAHQEELGQRFEEQLFPVLTPLAVDPGHPFPYISNLSLNLAVHRARRRAATAKLLSAASPGSRCRRCCPASR